MGQNVSFDIIARDKASATFSKIGRASDSTTKRLRNFAKSTAGLVGFSSLTVAAAGFVKVGADYSASLNKIQVLSGSTDTQLKSISNTLEGQTGQFAKMGQTTGDAADGMVELVKAGMSADAALQAVSATMVLAKAGGISVADSATLVSNTLNTFGLKAKRAGDVANYLANAANISSADVVDLAEAFKYVAPLAAAAGVRVQTVNALLAELANKGINASVAGTGLRNMFLSLKSPSGAGGKAIKDLGVNVFDAHGKARHFKDVLGDLAVAVKKVDDQTRSADLKAIFGKNGITTAQVLLDGGVKSLNEYEKGVTKAGAAQKLADAASKGFMGSLKQLRAEVLSSAQVAYRKLEPSLEAASNKLTVFVGQMKSGKGAGGDFVEILKDLAVVAKTAVKFLAGLPGPIKKFGIEGLIAYGIIKKLGGVTAGWGASIGGTTAKMKQFGAEMTYPETRMRAISGAGQAMGGMLRNVAGAGGMLLMADSASKAGTKLGLLESAAGGALSGAALGAFAGPVGAGVGAAIGGLAAGALTLFHNTRSAGDSAKVAIGKWQTYATTLDQVTGATTAATRAAALKAAQDSGLLSRTRSLGIADRLVVNALVNGGKARDAVVAASKKQIDATDAAIAAKKRELAANIATANDMSVPLAQQTAAANMVQANRKELESLKSLRASQQKDVDKVLDGVNARRKAVLETQKNAAAVNDLTGKLKGIPPNIRTQIQNEGIIPTIKGITTLAEKYRLTPKQVKTVIAASGVPLTQKQINHLVKTVNMYNLMHAAPKLDADTRAASRKIAALIAGIASINDKTVQITTSTNANVAEAVTPKHRASGGPVRAGTPYIVGEKRPELFVPSTNGTIVPKVPMSGGTQFVFSGDIYAQDVNGFLSEIQKRARHSGLDGRRR